jgi:hypothetical protein
MDYSAANTGLWNAFVYLGVIAGLLLLGNALNRKVRAFCCSSCAIRG